MPSLSLPTIPQNLPDVFVCQLVDGGVELPAVILASNEDETLSIQFPETERLRARLHGQDHAFFSCQLLSRCVLVIGPEVDGWDFDEEIIAL